MKLENDSYTIEIVSTDAFPNIESENSATYDFVYNPLDYEKSDYFKVFSIHVEMHDRGYSIALVGDRNSYDEDCAVLEGKILTVLQGWNAIQFDVESGQIIKRSELDSSGCNFGIFQLNGGYIIYGEIEITMLDHELQKKWSFSGYDIFISTTEKTPFEIKTDRICLYDFYDNYYEVDFDGNMITGPQRKVTNGK